MGRRLTPITLIFLSTCVFSVYPRPINLKRLFGTTVMSVFNKIVYRWVIIGFRSIVQLFVPELPAAHHHFVG